MQSKSTRLIKPAPSTPTRPLTRKLTTRQQPKQRKQRPTTIPRPHNSILTTKRPKTLKNSLRSITSQPPSHSSSHSHSPRFQSPTDLLSAQSSISYGAPPLETRAPGDFVFENKTIQDDSATTPKKALPPLHYNFEETHPDNIPLTAEELYYEMPPLAHDMFEIDPQEHRATLIFLPDCFETHHSHGSNFQMMGAKQLRVVVPNPPLRECTVLSGEEQRAWYDIMSVPFKPALCDLDYTGMKLSMYQVHQLIRDEAIRIGQLVAPFNAPPDEIERLGTERIFLGGFGQGAALATFAGLRYPKKLAGMISHSGYIPFIDQTADAARLLTQNQRKMWELDTLERQKIHRAEQLTLQSAQEHFRHQESHSFESLGETPFDISISAPNLRVPMYVLHTLSDSVFPWLELAQPSFIKAAKAPLKCNVDLRMGKADGHAVSSMDLLEMQFWQAEILHKIESNMPAADLYERDKLRELGEFGDSTVVVDTYSQHADKITMPWTNQKILEHAHMAQQDVKRVEELLKMIPRHPERLEEIANEVDLLNRDADDELWKSYLIEARQFLKQHEGYMSKRRSTDGDKSARYEDLSDSEEGAD